MNEGSSALSSADTTISMLGQSAVVISTALLVQVPSSGAEIEPLTLPTADFENLWVKMPPTGRDAAEVAVARRYPLHAPVAVSAKWPLPDQWIHRTVQRSPDLAVANEADTDDLLYTVYATNVSILGARQTDQLFTILLDEHEAVTFSSTETDQGLGTLRLRTFAVLKAVSPPRPEHDYIEFSPIIAITALLEPSRPGREGRRDLFRIYNSLDTARVEAREERFASVVTFLTGILAKQFVSKYHHLNRSQLTDLHEIAGDDRRKSEITEWIRSSKIRSLDRCNYRPITNYGMRYFLGTVARCGDGLSAGLIKRTNGSSDAINDFYTFVQCILAPGVDFDDASYRSQFGAEPASQDIRDFARQYLPEDSYVLTTPHSVGILAPGRRLEIVFGDEEAGNDSRKRFRRACAWNVLSLSLIAMQEALLAWYHRRIGDDRVSARGLARVAESAIRDFADYYDIGFFKSSASAFFRDAYERMQKVNGLDHEYGVLRERLSLALAKNNGDALLGVNRTLVGTWLGIALAMLVAVVSAVGAIRSSSLEDRRLSGIQDTLNAIAQEHIRR